MSGFQNIVTDLTAVHRIKEQKKYLSRAVYLKILCSNDKLLKLTHRRIVQFAQQILHSPIFISPNATQKAVCFHNTEKKYIYFWNNLALEWAPNVLFDPAFKSFMSNCS